MSSIHFLLNYFVLVVVAVIVFQNHTSIKAVKSPSLQQQGAAFSFYVFVLEPFFWNVMEG